MQRITQRSPKIVCEDKTDTEEQIDNLRYRAKSIYEKAKDADRELTKAEAAEFDNITDKKNGLIALAKAKLAALETELQQAREYERQIVMTSINSRMTDNGSDQPREVLPYGNNTPGHNPNNGFNWGNPANQIFPQVRSQRLRAFGNERAAYAGGMYIRALHSRLGGQGLDTVAEEALRKFGLEITNSSYEGSGTAGGYLVPPQLSQTIIDVRENVGVARRVCQVYVMAGDSLSIPKRAGGLTVYYPAELGTITDSDKNWAQIACAAKKRAVASKVSQELMDDALISVADNIFSEMAYALALREDQELVAGDGTSTYGGVMGLKSSIGTAGVYTCDANENTWAEIDLEDITNTMAKLPDRYNRSPAWICSSNFYFSMFARLLIGAAGNTTMDLQRGDSGLRAFFGVPVFTTSAMPTADADSAIHALFGQFDMAVVLGDRTGIRIGRDDSVGFLADYTTLKATSRYDINVHEPGDASNAGAYVALKTNAA